MQAVRETALPEAWYSLVNTCRADGDGFKLSGNQHRGIATGEIPEGLPGSSGHGMHGEKVSGT